jgi:hypothetical protein
MAETQVEDFLQYRRSDLYVRHQDGVSTQQIDQTGELPSAADELELVGAKPMASRSDTVCDVWRLFWDVVSYA